MPRQGPDKVDAGWLLGRLLDEVNADIADLYDGEIIFNASWSQAARHAWPQASHSGLCMQRVEPHVGHFHLAPSLERKASIPSSLIIWKFSKISTPYFLRYLFSRRRRLAHG